VNSRDHAGLTLLLRASSSNDPNALAFVQALIDHPYIDLYAQDPESGWNALHRSLYTGNASIARALLAKERGDLVNHTPGTVSKVGQLIKTKDHEGNSPFDLYNSTIAARSLTHPPLQSLYDDDSDFGDGDFDQRSVSTTSFFTAIYR
jgi:ankyrin repeat protein